VEAMESQYPERLHEVYHVIESVNAEEHVTKQSHEKTRKYAMLYNPRTLNKAFKKEFAALGWQPVRVKCDYPAEYYTEGYVPANSKKGAGLGGHLVLAEFSACWSDVTDVFGRRSPGGFLSSLFEAAEEPTQVGHQIPRASR